ncbi:metalloregulator ArsR/SmtB family transcription factor [Roseibacillus ishigakijimensis]|uniref:Metalloregulator ArsR/SmtB family transcription factor n=1 Tax=Roseibacillus ishigakijimensis TaxID=454146 RepID=A0A934RQG7_9BACT|nr:metalloregulator ArsR/SmtB family transcription factor [Roseibacillus ishigakijimensis]MBK1833214.1 metalloregulator ArsR/SmtB family transcription factor [Roseibacillus ishigakijimensis]
MPSILNSLKLLADPTRLRILLLLSRESLSVAELQEILAMGQSRISTQLAQLKKAELINDTRAGKSNIYQATLPPQLAELAEEAGRELPEHRSDLQSLKHILLKRKDTTRAYFDQLAGKFGKHYVPGRSWKSLAEALLKVHQFETVADLGAGEGTVAQLFAQRARQVIAIDNAPKMVEFGQKLAQTHQLANLEFRLGEIEEIPIEDGTVDLALFSQALHHAQSPARALAEAHRILKPGGTLIVLDLLQHSFQQARDIHHDVHLGFSEVQLSELLEAAGFHEPTTTLVDKEDQPPHFQTLLAVAQR